MTEHATTTDPPTPAPKRRATRRKRLTRLLLVVAALVLLITQTGVLKFAVLPAIESMLGCEAISGRVYVSPTGRVIVKDLELRVPGVDGGAARFFRAPRSEFVPDWGGIVGSGPSLSALRIDDATIRVSQAADQSLNIMKLKVKSGGGGGGVGGGMPSRLPEIELNRAFVEFGEHDAADYEPLATVLVSGELRASPQYPGVYTVDLAETSLAATGASAQNSGMRLDGTIDTRNASGSITLRDVDLREWGERTAPRRSRETYRLADIRGNIPALTFSFDAARGVISEFQLENVDLNIPIPRAAINMNTTPGVVANPSDTTPLEMRSVSGKLRFLKTGIEAELNGWIEDLPCTVKLNTTGYALDSGLVCTIESVDFLLGERPALLPFAPMAVHELLRKFSGPTATLTVRILVSREEPTDTNDSNPINSSGIVEFANGAMRYDAFPYPITNVRGMISFTNDLIKLDRLSGQGPTGASILATGSVIPDSAGPGLDLTIDAFGVPFDEHLLQTLRDIGRTEVERIFSKPAYERLIQTGLIRQPGAPATENAPPAMPLAGEVDVRVLVTRSPGAEPSLASDINITMNEGGVVCEVFPYPAVLEAPINLRITPDRVSMTDAKLKGLSGGEVNLNIDILDDRPIDLDAHPEVRINAQGVPVDQYLLHAVSETSGGQRGTWGLGKPNERTETQQTERSEQDKLLSDPASLLRALNIEGTVSSDARISFMPDDNATYRAIVKLGELSARPEGGQVMEGVGGQLILTNDSVRIDQLAARLGSGTVTIDGAARMTDGALDADSLTGTIRCEALPLEVPLAPIAGLFSGEWAARIQTIANERRPTGTVDATLELQGEDVRRIVVTGVQDAAFDALDGRVAIDALEGQIILSREAYTFDQARAAVRFDDLPLANLRVNGAITPSADDSRVLVAATDLSIGSAAVRRVVRGAAPGLVNWLESHHVDGSVELRLDLTRTESGWLAQSGAIRPSSMSMIVTDRPVSLDTMTGEVRWDDQNIIFDQAAIAGENFSAELAGTIGRAENADAHMTLSLDSLGIPDALQVVIPDRARAVLDALAITCDGPISINNAQWSRKDARESLDATINFQNAGFVTGVTVEEAVGTASVRMTPAPHDQPPDNGAFEVDINATSLRLAGVRMQNATIEVRSDANGSAVRVPVIHAKVHGGSMTGRAAVATEPQPTPGAPPKRRFEFSGELAGVPFSQVLADLGSSDEAARQVNRGTLEASLSLTGSLDDSARRGRGVVRVQGGDLLAMPGVVKLMELSNLQAPRGEMMEFGYADFFVQDNRLVVSDLSIMSPSIVVSGSGEIVWPDLDVQMNFRSQARSRIAIVSDILEGLRDEFVTTVARGTLYDPRLEFEQLNATRKFVETVFGGRHAHNRTGKAP